MKKLLAVLTSLFLVVSFGAPAQSTVAKYSVYQKTLSAFSSTATSLTAQQKAQVKAAVDANPSAEKFICTGIRYYSQPTSVNIMVRKRAKAACEYAKQLNPNLSTWYQNKPTQAMSYAGKVLLTVKSPSSTEVEGVDSSPTLSSAAARTSVKESTGLTATSWPVIRPQLSSSGCSETAIKLTYDSGKRFLLNGGVSYQLAPPQGLYGQRSDLSTGYVNAYTRQDPLKRVGPSEVPVSIKVCTADIPRGNEQFVMAKVLLYRETGSVFDGVEVKVDILDNETATSLLAVKEQCLNNQNTLNFPVAQTGATQLKLDPYTERITGTTAAIDGSIFVNSLALKNVEIRFFQEFENRDGAIQWPGELIAKAVTDDLGQFSVSLPIDRLGMFGSDTKVTAIARPSVQVLGDSAVVSSGASVAMYFNWQLSPGYYTGNKFDLPARTSAICESNYLSYINLSTGEDDDEKHRLANYLVLHESGRWFNGYKDSSGTYRRISCYDSSWDAACNYVESGIAAPKATEFGTLGSKCWTVRGHTRRLEGGKTTSVRSHRKCQT